jgi:D-alanyl-D-alanine carboxypeptidase
VKTRFDAATRAHGNGHTTASWWRRRRRLAMLTALVVLFAAVNVFLSTLYPIRLLRTAVHCASTSSRVVNAQLQCLVSGSIGKDGSVRSVELAVARGDGSYSWAGAAGVANRQGPVSMTADTPIYIASVTKVYIATLVMLLSERKLLALDDPIAKYLPAALVQGIDVYHRHDYSKQVTVRQLVSMTSGIPDYYEEKGPDGKTMFDLFVAGPAKTWTPDEMIDRARTDLKPHFVPGHGLYYSDTNYQLLGKIIERVTHTSLGSALQSYVLRPLRLRHTWLTGTPEPQGVPAPAHVFDNQRDITKVRSEDYWADGGLVSTPTDMIAFLEALNEGRIISAASLRTMQTWHARDGSPTPPIPGTKYGYGLWDLQMSGPTSVLNGVTPAWGATGSTGSFLYYSADRDLYMAGTVNSTSSSLTPFMLMGAVMTLFASK